MDDLFMFPVDRVVMVVGLFFYGLLFLAKAVVLKWARWGSIPPWLVAFGQTLASMFLGLLYFVATPAFPWWFIGVFALQILADVLILWLLCPERLGQAISITLAVNITVPVVAMVGLAGAIQAIMTRL